MRCRHGSGAMNAALLGFLSAFAFLLFASLFFISLFLLLCFSYNKKVSFLQMILSLEAPTRFELVIEVLQTFALPLGYGAIFNLGMSCDK